MRNLTLLMSNGLIVVAVVGLLALMSWAGRQGRPRPAPGSKHYVFRYNALFRWGVYLAAFVLPVGLTVLVNLYRLSNEARWYVFGLYVCVAVLTLPLVWEASRFYVCVTPEGLECRSAWRGTRFIAWDDLYEVRYSSINSWFIFRGTSGEKIRVTGFVAGLPALLGFVEMRLPATALKNARAGYEKAGRPFPQLPAEPVLEALPPR
jgi:hypothetical protein